MDRTLTSGVKNAGSIPVGHTKIINLAQKNLCFLFYDLI